LKEDNMGDIMNELEEAKKRLKEMGASGMNVTIKDPISDNDVLASELIEHISFVEEVINNPEKYK